MPYTLWSQDNFSKGELSPFMYARATTEQYLNGLKTAQNVLNYPTGAAGKRFGTLFDATVPGITSATSVYFQSFQYLDECVYQVIFAPNNIYIYLEGGLVATITSTGFTGETCASIINTVINSTFRITAPNLKPYDLTRADNSGIVVTGFSSTTLTLTSSSGYSGLIIPIYFTVSGGSIIQTTPQINPSVTYFAKFSSNTVFTLYPNSLDASNGTNAFGITSLGTGTTTAVPQNTWTFANTTFINLPYFDFNSQISSYDSLTFTPNATMGAAVTISVSGSGYSLLDSSYIGGVFFGAGGTSRIVTVASATSFAVAVQMPFDSTDAIQGSLVFLAEPAWSDKRGWPSKCSSYQNRALFANTTSLPNGFWASVINDYANFGDLTTDDDDAISWFPTSNNVNFIRFIVPYRSITVHTNSGIYSSPLSDIAAITPSNFTLQLQDSTPADVLQPQAIDNQIVVLSGDDAHQMLWDGINNAYTSDIISVVNEQTIRDPVDETAFADLRRAGSRFVFITNANGTLASFQTLISQNVAGITPQIMEQSYGNAYFRQTCSSSDGRCWFFTERQIATNASPINITGHTSSTLTATSSSFSTTTPTAITFTTSGALPASTPQLSISTYYWAIGVDSNTFMVYADQDDAIANVNSFVFTTSGTSSQVVPWPLTTIFNIEELTQDTRLDCAIRYNGTPVSTISTGVLFNAQSVKMVGDGFGFDAIGVGNSVTFNAHGVAVDVSEAYIGFPINMIIEPMPLTIANGSSAKETTLTKPKHIRSVRFMFNNTIGGTINGVPIALNSFSQANIGDPPIPANGIFELMVMKGWDDFNNPTYTIEHDEPFDIQLLGVFYSVDI